MAEKMRSLDELKSLNQLEAAMSDRLPAAANDKTDTKRLLRNMDQNADHVSEVKLPSSSSFEQRISQSAGEISNFGERCAEAMLAEADKLGEMVATIRDALMQDAVQVREIAEHSRQSIQSVVQAIKDFETAVTAARSRFNNQNS